MAEKTNLERESWVNTEALPWEALRSLVCGTPSSLRVVTGQEGIE